MCFELYHVQHLMGTCCESCLEQIVLALYGALSSISWSDGVESRVCFGSVNTLPCTAVPAAPPLMLSSGRLALTICPFFGLIMMEVEQRMPTIMPWRMFSLGLGNFWMGA